MGQPRRPAFADAALIGECALVIVATWLLIGWHPGEPIAQADGSVTWIPFLKSALAAGGDAHDHAYRFAVLGGSAMRDAGGSLPIVRLFARLGLSPTLAANLTAMFLQLLIAFFAQRFVASPSRVVRVAVTWACAFAPWLGWRLAYGHENLVLGLLPFVAVAGLWRRPPSVVAIVMAAIAVWHALSGLGAQMLVYALIFGGPLLIALRPTLRPTRADLAIVIAVLAGVALAMPELAGLVDRATSDDFPRAGTIVYELGPMKAGDWLASIPWLSAGDQETNFPLGPLIVIALATCTRRMRWTLVIVAAVVVLFASDVLPIASIPPLGAFRVPARALLPLLALVPMLACEVTTDAPLAYLLGGIALILLGRVAPPIACEVLAWAGAIAFIFKRHAAILLAVCALSVDAFAARIPRGVPVDPIEDGPAQLHDALIAQAPDLANPLVRVQIVDAPLPYRMSAAFAAGLGSLDGAWFPTRRFLALLGAVNGRTYASTSGVFELTRTRGFATLQQLYDVRYVLDGHAISTLPAPPGPAWFPSRIATDLANPRDAVLVEHAPLAPACSSATVRATVDAQTAAFETDTAAPCVLVVATNYVHTLRATADGKDLPVFPVDIALTGIDVPAGHTTVALAPTDDPAWPRVVWFIGVMLGVASGLLARFGISVARSPSPRDDNPVASSDAAQALEARDA